MVSADFLDGALADSWPETAVLAVGPMAPDRTPAVRVGVVRGERPHLRIDVFTHAECETFREIRCIGDTVAVGYGDHVHFVDAATRAATTWRLDGYFGELYTAEDFGLADRPFDFLVGSATALHRFRADGSQVWECRDLGVDGVLVHDVDGTTIDGDGEWDPPGGWQPFRVSLETGAKLDPE